MGTVRSPFKERAIHMRHRGMSLNEIQKALDLPSKGTLSLWFRDLKLSPKAQEKLRQRKQMASKQNLRTFNQARSRRIQTENEKFLKRGRKDISHVSKRELMLIGTALYWGEGTKSIPPRHSPSLAFTNSDPKMFSIYLRFLQKTLLVPDDRIRGGIHLYPTTDVTAARQYWSKVTNLPPDRFYIIVAISRASSGKRGLQSLPHGTLVLRVNDRRLFFRMRGMLEGLAKAKIK